MTTHQNPPSAVEEDDPFKAFDLAVGVGKIQNPYPHFAKMRETAAVHRVVLRAREAVIGGAAKTGASGDELYGYTVVRYPEALNVLRDDATFSSAGYQASMGVMLGNSIVSMDRPEHTHYRGLIQQAFSRGAMHRWENELVVQIVDRLLDPLVAAGGGDIVKAVTFPLPMQVIGGMFGLPEADLRTFHREAIAMVNMGHDWDRALQGSRWLHDYFQRLIEERRADPGGEDIISVLIAAEDEDGRRLDDEEIIAFLRNMLPAAADTTYRATSNLLQGLLRRPAQFDALRADRSLIPKAIEEGLRWESPITAVARTATRDVELGGVNIPAGSMVTVSIGAANHDQERWGPTAEDLDIHRPSQAHLSFANGPHVCLGIQLARMESRVFFERVLDRMPNLRLAPEADPVRSEISGLVFRSPAELPVVFE